MPGIRECRERTAQEARVKAIAGQRRHLWHVASLCRSPQEPVNPYLDEPQRRLNLREPLRKTP